MVCFFIFQKDKMMKNRWNDCCKWVLSAFSVGWFVL